MRLPSDPRLNRAFFEFWAANQLDNLTYLPVPYWNWRLGLKIEWSYKRGKG